MKYLLRIILSVAAFVALPGMAWADDAGASPVGHWKTIDDKTRQARSIVRIVEVNGELRGRIEKLLAPPKDDPDPICKKCTGDKKNKPVRGLEFLWGFKREAKGWSDGYVLDPEEGRTYHGSIQVIDAGKRLKLFGYVRVIIKIGRSQVWERVSLGDWKQGQVA
jgi:uncharacterized protein (DUF2147 family)